MKNIEIKTQKSTRIICFHQIYICMKNKNSEVSGVFPSHAYRNKNFHRNKNTLDQGVRFFLGIGCPNPSTVFTITPKLVVPLVLAHTGTRNTQITPECTM